MNLYDELGVYSNATGSEIKKAYKRKAQKNHPDKETGSVGKFKQIAHAYAVLSNDQRRKKYDECGDESEVPNEQAELITMLSQLFITFIDSGKKGNIVDLVIADIHYKLKVAYNKIATLEKIADNLETKLGRVVTHNKEPNLYESIIMQKLEIIKNDIIILESFINKMKKILEMLDNYEDCIPDNMTATSTTLFNTTGFINI